MLSRARAALSRWTSASCWQSEAALALSSSEIARSCSSQFCSDVAMRPCSRVSDVRRRQRKSARAAGEAPHQALARSARERRTLRSSISKQCSILLHKLLLLLLRIVAKGESSNRGPGEASSKARGDSYGESCEQLARSVADGQRPARRQPERPSRRAKRSGRYSGRYK